MDNPGPEFVRIELARLGFSGSSGIRRRRLEQGAAAVLPTSTRTVSSISSPLTATTREAGAARISTTVMPRLKIGGALVFDDMSNPSHPELRAGVARYGRGATGRSRRSRSTKLASVWAWRFAMRDKTAKAVVTGASGFIGTGARAPTCEPRLARARGRSEAVSRRRPAGDVGSMSRSRTRSPACSTIARRFSTWRLRRTSPGRSRTRATISRTPFAASSRCSRRHVRRTAASFSRRPRRSSMRQQSATASGARVPAADVAVRRRKTRRRGILSRLSSALWPRRSHRAAVQRLRRRHVPLRDPRHHPEDSGEPEEIEILGDGTQVRDYLYIDDAVRGLEMIATEGASRRGIQPRVGHPGATARSDARRSPS